ncbi:carbohydrate-binding protein [Microbacterium sp. Ag1]|uniref:carbohydrate-binding protein n=1 Tax=Microbacterium sp. Ag1 TaxID=1643443 RepID=UPI00069B5A9C|nr:carbohydrate-binding protein [Microbacterium sp. Ag1]
MTHAAAPVLLRDGVLAATITGARADAGRDLAATPYAVGEQVPYGFRVDNRSPVTVSAVPASGDFSPFLPPGAGNCRYRDLPVGAGYDCGTARHTVTQADIDRGFFVADTTWTVEAAGQSTKRIAVAGGEVDVIARTPGVSGTAVGEWADGNGNGVADASDTVTWTRTVENIGNVALDAVTAAGADVGVLAPGERTTLDPIVVRLTTDDIARGSIDSAPFDAAAVNGAHEVSAAVGAVTLPLTTAPGWSAQTVYAEGQLVSLDGRLWQASWWTRDQRPGDPVGPWQELVSDAEGAAVWTATRVFTTGDTVVHDGMRFEAKWWTRNQQPEAATTGGPWRTLD